MAGLTESIVEAWDRVAAYVANGHAGEFRGKGKERAVLGHLGAELNQRCPDVVVQGLDDGVAFGTWSIDLVCCCDGESIAIEGKYKITSDGAVPDNRKAAFRDLMKLEQYVASGAYDSGLFLWLTDVGAYLRPATGDSQAFSTHDRRVYRAGTELLANRDRSGKPLALTLQGTYSFEWQRVDGLGTWYSLAVPVHSGAVRQDEPRNIPSRSE